MNEKEMLTALQNLLIAATWTGGSNVVFPTGSVLITPNLEEGLKAALNNAGMRTPICLMAPESVDSDPEFDEEPDLQKFVFTCLLCVTIPGGAVGQETLMSANVPDSTKSEGQGLLAVEQEFFDAVGKLNALESVIIQNIQRSEGGGAFHPPGTYIAYRTYRLEAWGTIGASSSSSSSSITTTTTRQLANQTDATGTLANITNLLFLVTSGTIYYFKFNIIFSSDTATVGLKVSLTIPAVTSFSANAAIPIAADSSSAIFYGWITSSGDAVTATAVQVTGTTYLATIEGMILPSASGTLQAQFASETIAGTITVYTNSTGILKSIP